MQIGLANYVLTVIIGSLIFREIKENITTKEWFKIYKPTVFVGIILSFYTILAPIYHKLAGIQTFRTVDHSPYLYYGWLATLIFYLSYLAGFYTGRKKNKNNKGIFYLSDKQSFFYGNTICILSLSLFIFIKGLSWLILLNPFFYFGGLNFIASSYSAGAFTNLFNLAINFSMPGILLIWSSQLNKGNNYYISILWMIVNIIFYVAIGFRYRIVILGLSVSLVYFFKKKKKPPIRIISFAAVLLIVISGFIGLTRRYGEGLNISEFQGKGVNDVLYAAFVEAEPFYSSSAVIANAEANDDYIGMEPILNLVSAPIPRAIWPNKPSGRYIFDRLGEIYTVIGSQGATVLNFVEYFLMYGWPSLIIISYGFGYFSRNIWNWFLSDYKNNFRVAVYFLFYALIYYLISRGYIGLSFNIISATFLPLILLRLFLARTKNS